MRKKWTTPRLSPSLFRTAFSDLRNNNTIEYDVVFSVFSNKEYGSKRLAVRLFTPENLSKPRWEIKKIGSAVGEKLRLAPGFSVKFINFFLEKPRLKPI